MDGCEGGKTVGMGTEDGDGCVIGRKKAEDVKGRGGCCGVLYGCSGFAGRSCTSRKLSGGERAERSESGLGLTRRRAGGRYGTWSWL